MIKSYSKKYNKLFLFITTSVFALNQNFIFAAKKSHKEKVVVKEKENIIPQVDVETRKKLLYHIPLTLGGAEEKNAFFSCMSRMRHIPRWTLLRVLEREDIEQHSCEVARIAHMLAIIKNKKYGGHVDVEKVLLYSLYHDVQEISTSDFPNPVKYFSSPLTNLLRQMDDIVSENFLTLIEDEELREAYVDAFIAKDEDKEVWRIVKMADTISAMIKCLRERDLGNNDFNKAFNRIYNVVLSIEEPEARYFIKTFMPAYSMQLPDDYSYPPFQGK